MQEIEWMSLDHIEHDNTEDAPVVKDPEVRTLIFDPTTENVVCSCTIFSSGSVWSKSWIFVSCLWAYAKVPKMSSCVPNK